MNVLTLYLLPSITLPLTLPLTLSPFHYLTKANHPLSHPLYTIPCFPLAFFPLFPLLFTPSDSFPSPYPHPSVRVYSGLVYISPSRQSCFQCEQDEIDSVSCLWQVTCESLRPHPTFSLSLFLSLSHSNSNSNSNSSRL